MTSDPTPDVILSVESVSKSFGGVKAVSSCNLAVETGTVTGLIGPNGAGKSTLLGLISGFLPVDAGRIFFRGEEIQRLPAYKRSRMGMIRSFQEAREWGRLTTLENVLVALTPISNESLLRSLTRHGRLRRTEADARTRAREVLAEFGLQHVSNELAGNLSGGQKRLLEFARIACAEPQMVLLDEPQAGVNPLLGDRMAAAIEALNARGATVLIVEHNLPFIERLCSRVNVMNFGTDIATGTMTELRDTTEVVDAYLGMTADVQA